MRWWAFSGVDELVLLELVKPSLNGAPAEAGAVGELELGWPRLAALVGVVDGERVGDMAGAPCERAVAYMVAYLVEPDEAEAAHVK